MKFIEPKFKNLYDTLKNNKKLENMFVKKHILLTLDDYFEIYGYEESKIDIIKYEVELENSNIYENLTYVLLDNLDYIKNNSVSTLVLQSFLRREISDAFNFSEDVDVNNELLNEIYYTVKYCYVSSFFQNNYEEFLPQADFREIENNAVLTAFLDGIMKEFDKLDNILDNFKKFKDYQEIPYEYITHLSQLLGCEPKNFMLLETQKRQYRTLAENILDVYSVKGTSKSFELLFNFLGYNVVLKEYYFDRRNYFLMDGINKETNVSDNEKVQYYLTTIDPRKNLLANIACNEIVTQKDISPKENIRNFDVLVEEYGLLCVLGYNDTYEVNGETKLYKGPVFKYFNTNYVSIQPSLRYSDENLSLNELYQLKALVDFLLPKFKQRELTVKISTDTGDNNGSEPTSFDGTDHAKFVLLDGEDWNQDLAKDFISNYDEYEKQGYVIPPKIIKDNGKEVNYYNSIGEQFNNYKDENHNVFYNPISEKIKIINTTKYWGDKIKTDDSEKMYEVWRVNEKGNKQNDQYRNPFLKINGSIINKLYLPRDLSLLNRLEQQRWFELENVELNGFTSTSLRMRIKSMDNKIPVERVNVLADYITNKSYEYAWKEIDNFSWKLIYTISNTDTKRFSTFVKTHNVINYDYLNDYLYAKNNEVIDFNDEVNNFVIKNNNGVINNEATTFLQNMYSEFCYYICIFNNSYYVYKYTPIKKIGDTYIRRRRPIVYSGIPKKYYTFKTYKEAINSIIEDENAFYNNNKKISIDSTIFFYIINDNTYYKLITVSTNYRSAAQLAEISLDPVEQVGAFYIQDGSRYDNNTLSKTATISEKQATRDVKLFQYKKTVSEKGKLIYSNNTLLEFVNNSAYIIDNHIFGLRAKKFYGNIIGDYIKEFDSYYEGFSEKDDDENYLLNNYSKTYNWKEISGTDRPIKDNTDNIFISNKEDISENIFKEILGDYNLEKKFKDKIVNENKNIKFLSLRKIYKSQYYKDTKEVIIYDKETMDGKDMLFDYENITLGE